MDVVIPISIYGETTNFLVNISVKPIPFPLLFFFEDNLVEKIWPKQLKFTLSVSERVSESVSGRLVREKLSFLKLAITR